MAEFINPPTNPTTPLQSKSAKAWASPKYGGFFKQIDQEGKMIARVECRECKKQFSLESRLLIKQHYDSHHRIADTIEIGRKKLLSAALDVVAKDSLPFQFIERPAMRALLRAAFDLGKIDPRVTEEALPSERTLRRTMLKRAEEMKKSPEFLEFVNGLKFGGCLSYDFGVHGGKQFLTIHGHTLCANFELMTSTLVFEEYSGVKSREAVKMELERSLGQIGLTSDDVAMMHHVTDGAVNMAVQNEKFHHVCLCHVLNRILEHTTSPYADSYLLDRPDAVQKLRGLNDLIDRIRSMVFRVKKITTASKLVAPTNVRFYSSVTMVRSFVDHGKTVLELITDENSLVQDFLALCEEMDQLTSYLLITEPIVEWIVYFEKRDRPTIHKALPALAGIEAGLDKTRKMAVESAFEDDRSDLKRILSEAALDALDWNISETRGSKVNRRLIYCAAALDEKAWRSKLPVIFGEVTRWKESEMLNSLRDALLQAELYEGFREQLPTAPKSPPQKKLTFDFDSEGEDESWDEVSEYVRSSKITRSVLDLLDWWRNVEKAFPKLNALARQILCVPGGNIEAERTFSVHKLMKSSERRSSLSKAQESALMLSRTPFTDISNSN